MRVLHIDTERTWRGGENQLRLLLEGLERAGVEGFVAVQPDGVAAERLAALGTVLRVPMRGGFDLPAVLRLRAACERHRIELVDAHTSNGHALGLLLKLLLPRLRLVVHRRVDFPPAAGGFSRRKYLTPRIDRYVAISDAIRRVLLAYGVPAGRVAVVKSAVETGAYDDAQRPAARAALAVAYGVPPERTFIGNASALTPQKGYETLLDAAAELKRRGVPFHVFIAGDGELTGALERRRIALALEHDVTFLGFITDVPSFLSGLDVLAVPSRDEGLGTILLEGIGAGLAIAATRVGGIPEVVRDGETGLLSAAGDAAGLAANLARLAADPALRARLLAAARMHVAQQFTVSAMVAGNLAVYRQLLGSSG